MVGPPRRSRSQGISKGHLRKATEDQFVFVCEWLACEEKLGTMNEFNHHVNIHRRHYTQSCEEDQETDMFEFYCQWRDCGASIEGTVDDFSRHVFYHTFHQYLKHLGAHVQEVEKLSPCTLGLLSRNVIPELPERLVCRWNGCQKDYDNPYIFYGHVTYHCDDFPKGNHPNQPIRCRWDGCTAVAKSCHRMREHMRSHTQAKTVACPQCGALFSNNTKFIDHLKRQAGTHELTYECPHCHRRFPSERILRDHMRRHVNHYKCPICDMTCYAPSALRDHIQYRHTEERNFSCDKCHFFAKREADLRKHLNGHLLEKGGRTFPCLRPHCGQKFASWALLKGHYIEAHPTFKQYQCHLCQKAFIRGSFLTQHLRNRHNYKWPSGHKRFRYKVHADGYRRLQTTRYESIEVSEQVLGHRLTTSTSDGPQAQDTAGGDTVIVTVGKNPSRAGLDGSRDHQPEEEDEKPLDLSCHSSRFPAGNGVGDDHPPTTGFSLPSSPGASAHFSATSAFRARDGGVDDHSTIAVQRPPHHGERSAMPVDNNDSISVAVAERRGRKRKGVSKGQGGKSQKRKTTKDSNGRKAEETSSRDNNNSRDSPVKRKSCMKRKARDSGTRRSRSSVKRVGFGQLVLPPVPSRLLGSALVDEDSSNSSTLYTMFGEGDNEQGGNGDSLSAAANLIDKALQDSSRSSPLPCGRVSPTRYKLTVPEDVAKGQPSARYTLRSLSEEAESSPTRYALKTPDTETDLFSDGPAASEGGQSPTRYTLNLPDEVMEPPSPSRYTLESPWQADDCPSPSRYTLQTPDDEGGQSPTRYKLNDYSDDERPQSPTLYTLALEKEKPTPLTESQVSYIATPMALGDDDDEEDDDDDEEDRQSKYALDSSFEETGQSPTRYALASVTSFFDENAQSPTKYQLQYSLNESVQSSTRYALETPSQDGEFLNSFRTIEGEVSPAGSVFRLKSPLVDSRDGLGKQECPESSQSQTDPQYVVAVIKQENDTAAPKVNWSVPSPKFLSHLDPSVFQAERSRSTDEVTSPVGFGEGTSSHFGLEPARIVAGPRTSSPLPKYELDEMGHVEQSQSWRLLTWNTLFGDNDSCLKMPPTPGNNILMSPSKLSPDKDLSLPSESSSLGFPVSTVVQPSTSTTCASQSVASQLPGRPKRSAKKSWRLLAEQDNSSLGKSKGDKGRKKRHSAAAKPKKTSQGKGGKKGRPKAQRRTSKTRKTSFSASAQAEVEESCESRNFSLPAGDFSKDETYNLKMLGEVALLTSANSMDVS